MKKFIIPSLLLLSSAAYAETPSLNVHSNDGNVATYSLDEVESVTFEDITKWTIATAVGSGADSDSEGDALTANLKRPMGVAVTPDGTIYATSNTTNRVVRIANGQMTTVKLTLPAGSAVNNIWGIAAEPDGNLVFTSKGNKKVFRMTPDGNCTEIAPGDGKEWDNPMDIKVTSDGTIYVANRGSLTAATRKNQVIRKIETDGTITDYNMSDCKQGPCAIGIDGQGNIYAGNGADFVIYKFTADGQRSTIFGKGAKPTAANWNEGTPGDLSAATFGQAFGLDVTADGTVYIADQVSYVLLELIPGANGDHSKGTLKHIIGKPFTIGKTNGVGEEGLLGAKIGTTAMFLGQVICNNGKIYIADQGNSMIRVVTAE